MRRHRTRSASSAAPGAAEINRRTAVRLSRFVTLVGDKMLSRTATDTNADGPLGLIRLASAGPGAAAALAVSATSIVAEGTDLGSAGQAGTWAYPLTGNRQPTFLGASSGFVLEVDSSEVWLVDGSTIREVSVRSGTGTGRSYVVDGRLVAAAGAGLVLQRGDQVVWWLPGLPGQSEVIGTGEAVTASFEYILWRTTSGLLTITDPNTLGMLGHPLRVPLSQPVVAAALDPYLDFRVAVATGDSVAIGDTFSNHAVTVHLRQVNGLAWLDHDTLLARVGAQGVTVIDASSGTVVHEPHLPFDAQGLGVVETPSP